jgi:hypothetical protein
VVALVEGLSPEQVGRRAGGRRGPFALPINGRKVVRPVCNCSFANIKMLCGDILGDQRSCQLKIGVSDVAAGVPRGDKALSDFRREFRLPNQGGNLRRARLEWGVCTCSGKRLAFTIVDGSSCSEVCSDGEPDAAHAEAGGIACTDQFGGGLGHELVETGRPGG